MSDQFGLPPVDFDLGDEFEETTYDDYTDEEIERIIADGDHIADIEQAVNAAQGQLGRRIVPREVEALGPYVIEQRRKGEQIDVRGALDRYYGDNPRAKQPTRQELMAAAIDATSPPPPEIEPPGELPANATEQQRRDHRRARMVWAMEQDRLQGQGG